MNFWKCLKDKIFGIIHCIKNLNFLFLHSIKYVKWFALLNFLTSVIIGIAPALLLHLYKTMIDAVASTYDSNATILYVVVYFLATILFAVFESLSETIYGRISRRCDDNYGYDFSRYKSNIDYVYLESGEFLNKERTIRVAMSPTLFLFQHFAGFIKDIISVISYSYIIVQINPWLLSIFLLKIIITGVLNAKQQQEQYNFENEVVLSNRRLEYIHNTIFDISSAKEIRINGAFSWLITKYKKENRNNIKIIQKKSKKDIKHSIIKNIIEQIQTLITYGYSSYLAVNNVISVGNFTAFIASISRFINSFDSVINQSVGLYYISKRVDFFMEYLSYFKKSDENKCSIPEHILDNPCIEFKNVSFKYPNSSDYVLKNISLKIIPKEKLAIVGHNGSGKTTFVKLLCKLYEPTEGEILLNGKNINYYNTKEYRKLFGVLMQDFKLFDFRVKDNIVLNKEFNEELFDNSIEKADAKSLIHSLPFGINTYCGRMFDENGVDLSGGENQRIGLSRTYYGKAKILILDEPDSALDVYSENKIYDSFKSAMKDTTSLYISHRLALCTYCDRILVFDDGCLAENGSHYELMHNDGIYAEMFKKQTSYYKN